MKKSAVLVALCASALVVSAGESSKPVKKASADSTSQKAQSNLEIPESLFTLPTPKYKLPKDIQNLIMFSVTTDTKREVVLRDEYKTVYKDKKALKAWLNEALDTAIAIWMNGKVDAMEAASRRGDIMTVLKAQSEAGENGSKLINRAKGWQAYAKSDW